MFYNIISRESFLLVDINKVCIPCVTIGMWNNQLVNVVSGALYLDISVEAGCLSSVLTIQEHHSN